jgi:hypothetical protein
MTRERRLEIFELTKTWTNEFPDMTIKDSLFALYDDRDILGTELDFLIDWMTL